MTYETADLPLVDLVGAAANEPRGHIALGEPDKQAVLTFCDMGDHLAFWSFESARLGPTEARNLAAALVAWADRKEGRG